LRKSKKKIGGAHKMQYEGMRYMSLGGKKKSCVGKRCVGPVKSRKHLQGKRGGANLSGLDP